MATAKSPTAKTTTAKKPTVTKPAAGKTATPKTTAKKTTAKTTTAKTATTRRSATAAKKPAEAPSKPEKKAVSSARSAQAKVPATPTPEQRYRMVQDAAYFIAEKNGFKAGSMDYWIAAEAEIEILLSGKEKP